MALVKGHTAPEFPILVNMGLSPFSMWLEAERPSFDWGFVLGFLVEKRKPLSLGSVIR